MSKSKAKKDRKRKRDANLVEGKEAVVIEAADESKSIRNISNPYILAKNNATNILRIENKREAVTIPVIANLLKIRSVYFSEVFSTVVGDASPDSSVTTIPEDQPYTAAELILELHRIIPDFSEWNCQWAQLSEKWQMQEVSNIYRELCAKKLTKMFMDLKNMNEMKTAIVVTNCEYKDADGVYNYNTYASEGYYAKKVNISEEYRIFRQQSYNIETKSLIAIPSLNNWGHASSVSPSSFVEDESDDSVYSESSSNTSTVHSQPQNPPQNSNIAPGIEPPVQIESRMVWCLGIFNCHSPQELMLSKLICSLACGTPFSGRELWMRGEIPYGRKPSKMKTLAVSRIEPAGLSKFFWFYDNYLVDIVIIY